MSSLLSLRPPSLPGVDSTSLLGPAVSLLVLAASLLWGRSRRTARLEATRRLVGGAEATGWRRPGVGLAGAGQTLLEGRVVLPVACALAVLGGLVGWWVVAPVGLPLGALAAGASPFLLRRRRAARKTEILERQLAEAADAIALAVRSGQSIAQALEFAATEADAPMRDLLAEMLARQRLGASLDEALERFERSVGSDDAALLVLILSTQSRAGGQLAQGLDEVRETIRYRMALRRDLRAMTAQGRISGAVLGALPVAFFVVLALTSRHELDPVFRSPPGIAMVSSGLLMQGIAYLWIRRLLRVRV